MLTHPETLYFTSCLLPPVRITGPWRSQSESGSVVSDSLQYHRLCSLWNSLGQNTGLGRLSLGEGPSVDA